MLVPPVKVWRGDGLQQALGECLLRAALQTLRPPCLPTRPACHLLLRLPAVLNPTPSHPNAPHPTYPTTPTPPANITPCHTSPR